jgi:protein-S-isoprenylcysteine O-methyltransferase Ste14
MGMIRRTAVLGYGMVAYVAFVATLTYLVGFLAGAVVPKGVDDGARGPTVVALAVDVGLLALFAGQHSVMARPWFKRWWTRLVPTAIERSTYVLAASAVLALVMWQWRPLPDEVWSVRSGEGRALVWTVYLGGWGLALLSTFLIGHFDLFGVRQVLHRWRQRRYLEPEFREPWLYRLIRHPLLLGFLIAFWAAPDMSAGRLLFAVVTSGYILAGARFEEHDLDHQLGESYRRYRQRVPGFIPLAGRKATVDTH